MRGPSAEAAGKEFEVQFANLAEARAGRALLPLTGSS